METFADSLHNWQTFYFTAAAAAATLTGLMFVALSLALPLVSRVPTQAFKTFTSPSILHFVSVLMLALALLVPVITTDGLGLLLLIGGLLGFALNCYYAWRLYRAIRRSPFNLGEWLTQIILPVIAYVLILIAAVNFLYAAAVAFPRLCVGAMLLLFCGIANTWALVGWVVEQSRPKP